MKNFTYQQLVKNFLFWSVSSTIFLKLQIPEAIAIVLWQSGNYNLKTAKILSVNVQILFNKKRWCYHWFTEEARYPRLEFKFPSHL